MREFADHRINSSDEYRLKYLHEVEQNKKLTLVNENLRKQLADMEKKFTANQQHTQNLEEKLQVETQKANGFEQKNVEVERKLVQVKEECTRQEERVEKMKKLNTEMLEEFDKAENNQIILDEKIKTLEIHVGNQADRIKQKEMVNCKLSRQVNHLKKVCQASKEKSIKDTQKIKELKIVVSKQQSTIMVYEDFKTRFQARERKILLKLEALEMHQHGKSQSRFFTSLRRPSQSQWLVKSISALFENNILSNVDAHLAVASNERLI